MPKKKMPRETLDGRYAIRLPVFLMEWCKEQATKRHIPVSIIIREGLLTAMQSSSSR